MPPFDSQLKTKQIDETTSSWGGAIFDSDDLGTADGLGNFVPNTVRSQEVLSRSKKGQTRVLVPEKTLYYLDADPEESGAKWVPIEPWPTAGGQTIGSSVVTRVVAADEVQVLASNWGQRMLFHDDVGPPSNVAFKAVLSGMALSAVTGSGWSEALWNTEGQGRGIVTVSINGVVVPHLHENSLADQTPFSNGIYGWLYRSFGTAHYACFFRPSPDGLNRFAHPSVTVPDESYSANSADESVPLLLAEGDVVSVATVSITEA